MTRVPTLALALIGALLLPRPAAADVTAFLGATLSPDERLAKGASIGSGLLILGFEFEYATTGEDPARLSPSLRTGMANVLLQTPVAILRMQPYVTTGTGLYRERLGAAQDTGVGFNTGGGVKITLAGPLRLRLDYRWFRLGDDAVVSPAHRVYAGLNLAF